jgi:15-cis-phytoene synthase
MALTENAHIPPTALDPRLMVMVPRLQREAVAALWHLDARLFGVVAGASEVMLAQIKLAWWRDRLVQVAGDAGGLPKGEPLLAELAAHWAGRPSLVPMTDAYEAILLAEDADALGAAGRQLAAAMGCGAAWGLVRAAQLAGNAEWQAALWRAASDAAPVAAPRHVRTLDRWAQLLARDGGAVTPRAEGWLLLRAGLGL